MSGFTFPYRLNNRFGDWYTPADLFQFFHFEHGPYDIDVAANALNTLCQDFYSPEQDGLKQTWAPKKRFCNPPYGKILKRWVAKVFHGSKSGAMVSILLPAQTDTNWFHDYVLNKAQIIYFIQGRVKFGDAAHAATFPSIVAHYDFHSKKFVKRDKLLATEYRTLDYRKRK